MDLKIMISLAFQASPLHLKRKKEKKESRISGEGFKRSQVFLIKYNPNGWRFYQKPAGLELYFLKPELTFTFFFLFFFVAGCS
jgi:hypothetical protein